MSNGMNYLAVWRSGSGGQWWSTGLTTTDFKAKDKDYFDKGYRLSSMRIEPSGRMTGVWHPGSGAQWWATGLSVDAFKAKDKGYFDQGLRLVDIEVHNGQLSGVWRPGSGGQWWATGLSSEEFKAKDKGYFDQGYRLICMRIADGKFTGVWHPGSGAQWWVAGLSSTDFKAKDQAYFDQGLRLADIEIHDGKFYGVWRPGSGAQWWSYGNDLEMAKGRDRHYFDSGLRLTKMFPYVGNCDSDCLNQVVMPTGSYNYGITSTALHCKGLPGSAGTPAPGAVVAYRWPCLTFDGSVRLARMSALEFKDAGLFTLPFTDAAVKMHGPWEYSPGSWHHAIDFSRDDTHSFEVKAAAAGTVIFIGWDAWSGNTMVVSHDSGGVKDAFRTIYMHLRNGPQHDADQSWNSSVPILKEPQLSQFKTYLKAIGCPQGGPYHPDPAYWGSDADKINMSLLGKQVAAGSVIAHAGCTGPGGAGSTSDKPGYVWSPHVNTHLHIFFSRRDTTDNEWYFIDPFGIYASNSDGCYPGFNEAITTPCARYPVAWKGRKAQYP
ncbi:MAG: hypothetical protein JWQ90_3698 [Hydrocarboniphaga sp.]|uniref:M23 family metallopeptidase n=1 Tax=Hydrocarboniphaga sp. TaxID=2033016 RepID=UPI00262BD749|nr:M23 family metallopeptidase [Hydrocarboniphaga sp.]MDB5971248.1 hypothetical protein [Hydrocarboniphaga sp.]